MTINTSIKDCTLYNGDCLNVLRDMKDNSVETIITSPPYNLNKRASGGGNSKQNYDSWYPDDMPEKEYQLWQQEIIRECLRVSRGSVFYNHKVRYAWHSRNKYKTQSKIYHPMDWLSIFPIWCEIIWDRCGTTGHSNGRCRVADERIFQIGKPSKFFEHGYSTIWKIKPSKNIDHVCTFPEKLVERCLLLSTDKDDIILDPFMGVGTTGIVSKRMSRKFVGIELDKDYFDISVNRLLENQEKISL